MDSAPEVESKLSRRLRYQEVVADLGQRALEINDLEQLLHEITVAVAETLNVDYTKVLELLPGGEEFVLRDGVGWHDERIGEATVPATSNLQAGYTLGLEEAVIVDDLHTEDRFSGPELLTDHGVVSGISVLIGSGEEPWGVLGAHTAEPREFTEHDAAFLQRVANVLATAVENENARHRLEEMTTRISDGFYSLDDDWEFTYVNEHATELIDVTEDGLVGKHVWETFEWAADSRLRDEYERAMETGEATTFELYYPEPLESWYQINAYPSETGLSVYFRDITDRKVIEADHAQTILDLQENEERLQLALDAGEMGTWELDLQSEESPVRSPQHDRIFGYEEPLDDWSFETFLEHVHPDDREEVKRRYEEAFETGAWEFDCRIIQADGGQRWIAAQGEFHFDSDGEPARAVGVVQDITDRKARERELEKSEQLYQTLVDHFPNGAVAIVDTDLRYVTFGGTPEGDTQITRADIEGSPVRDLPEELRAVVAPHYKAALDGEASTFERTIDGRIYQFHFVPIRDDAGDVFAAMGLSQDVTDQKEREHYLEDTKARLEAATEAGAVGTWEWNVPEDRMVVGTSFAQAFGINPDEAREGVSLDRFVEAIYKADRAQVETAVEEAVETCGEYREEYRVWDSDGDLRWVVARGHVECDEDGNPVTFPGALTDITERKEAEEALLEREAEFRMVAENLDEVIWITSPETMEYQYISPAFDDIWGVSRQTLYDDPGSYVQWVHPEDRERVHENFTELPDTPLDQEFRVVRPDGDVRWLHVRGEYVESEEGIARVIGIGQDVTQRVEHERKLEESNERLEQFAYAASHDLQEPLRMVSSYLQLLERRYADELDEDAREFIDFAVDGADRMQEMIDGLLEFARVETEGAPFEPVDLEAVLDDVRTDLQLRIEESDAELTADPLPEVYGDSGQLREVLQNLVSNAIEYSGDDPPRIHVSAERKGSQWCISVRDEGIGIDPADSDRVFDVFQRLHTQEENKGTGIGLAMCERIIERHGGEIWVDSDPGEGSTFSFTVPAADP